MRHIHFSMRIKSRFNRHFLAFSGARRRFLSLCLLIFLGLASYTPSHGCEHLLGFTSLFDPHLVQTLQQLSFTERDTKHVTELEPLLKKVRELSVSLQHRGTRELVAYIDALLAQRRVSYHALWYVITVQLLFREPQTESDTFDIFRTLSANSDGSSYRIKFLTLTREHRRRTTIEWLEYAFRDDQRIYIPGIDAPTGPQSAVFEPGQFARSFIPSVYHVGISRLDKQNFDFEINATALEMTAHDFQHAISIATLLNLPPDVLIDQHQNVLAVLSSIEDASIRRTELINYEHLLFEEPNLAKAAFLALDGGLRDLFWQQSLNASHPKFAEALGCSNPQDRSGPLCFFRIVVDPLANQQQQINHNAIGGGRVYRVIRRVWTTNLQAIQQITDLERQRVKMNAEIHALKPGEALKWDPAANTFVSMDVREVRSANLKVLADELYEQARRLGGMGDDR